ncbi:MAG: hypothetical protein AAFR23_09250, partial [Pseudomonadota bacterium]
GKGAGGSDLIKMTASSMNRAFGPSRDKRMAPLVSDIIWQENFGQIDIDWVGRSVTLSIRDVRGAPAAEMTLPFNALGMRDQNQ